MSTPLEQSTQRWGNWFQRRSVTGLVFASIGLIIALVIFFTILGWALNWFGAGVAIVSPTNVKAQFALAYDDYEALQKLNDTLCISKQAIAQAVDANTKTQRQTQLLAYEAQYNRVAAEYQARYDDAFRAALVGPKDLPKTIPPVSTVLAACA
jgi:uncharacterized protein YacL